MGNVAGEQRLFHANLLNYSLKNPDCHKFSCFNDGGLKLGHVGIFDALFPFLAILKFSAKQLIT